MDNRDEVTDMLVERIRLGDSDAWESLIQRFEGRLLAFAENRVGIRAAAEDIVQDTFVGFLNSLPNYDGRRPLESYLFSICAYKLTDYLRREGRRPKIPLSSSGGHSSADMQLAGSGRPASSIARSAERKGIEEKAVVAALKEQVDKWKERGDWQKLKCIELLFVVGMSNKDAAVALNISEQQVANFKFDFLARTKTLVGRQNLNPEIFPELGDGP